MQNTPKTGVLLINLGSPSAPTVKAVKRFLAQFLSDSYVVQLPRWIWWWILHGLILRFYPKRSAEKYQRIWSEDGSPLITLTQRLRDKLQQQVNDVSIVTAMRYGNPSISDAITQLQQQGVQRVITLPLYPQYARSTTASSLAAVKQALSTLGKAPELDIIEDYHANPHYIQAISQQITQYFEQHGKPQRLIFSFHGLPKRVVDQGDPYYQQCQTTVKLITESVGLQENEWILCFQSRFGPSQWLQPYTFDTIEHLAQQGLHHIAVICPGFAVDCLETLEEINLLNRESFLQAGGKRFDYIPALNDSDAHALMLAEVVREACYP